MTIKTNRLRRASLAAASAALSLAVFLGISPALSADAGPPAFDFSIRNMMRGPELYGRAPENVRWTADGKWIYFNWVPPGTGWQEEFKSYRVHPVAGAKPEEVSDAQMDAIGPSIVRGERSRDGKRQVVVYNGDLYLVAIGSGAVRRLTETTAFESSPLFSADGKLIYFTRDDNVMSFDLEQGLLRQLTDIRTGPAPKEDPKPEGQKAALRERQQALFEAIRDGNKKEAEAKARQKEWEQRRLMPRYLDAEERVAGFSPSPNGRALLFSTVNGHDKPTIAKVPNYVTASGYTEELETRPKAGDVPARGRFGYMTLPGGEIRWLTLDPKQTTSVMAEVLSWNEDGSAALVTLISRDRKTRYLYSVDAAGRPQLIDELHDEAWVDGPCSECGGWYDGGRRIWFVSEADGYAHIYSTDAHGGDRKQLTRGKWEVLDVELSADKRFFEMHTSEVSPFEQHYYRMPVTGGARERITTRPGGHAVTLSPDGKMLADVFSAANRPPELFIAPNKAGAELIQLTTSPTAEWLAFPWIVPQIVWIPASDGVKVPARIYKPADMQAASNGAGVIFVHGAGYLHNVHNYWSRYPREYMFHHFLASKGYTVLDIDYRGSAGYGRDWRTAIYRWMGGRDLQDQVDGSRYLEKEFGIAPEHVGIYGGSYGGFMTLMALFTEPKHFGAGAALRSVTDWANYAPSYSGDILNDPQDDAEAYRRSSPIFFAEGLEDPLLIMHGMVDTNVHFQDSVLLAQRLIELGKTRWEMAVYPMENHSFLRPSSWADEYRRIFELFENNLPARVTKSP